MHATSPHSFAIPLIRALSTTDMSALSVLNLSSVYGKGVRRREEDERAKEVKGAKKKKKRHNAGESYRSVPARHFPVVDDDLLAAIGRHCGELTHIDISYNRDVSSRGLAELMSRGDDHLGCPKLNRLEFLG